jgi:hypothetical protein
MVAALEGRKQKLESRRQKAGVAHFRHGGSCMYAPVFSHRRRNTLRGGNAGKRCRRHPAKLSNLGVGVG